MSVHVAVIRRVKPGLESDFHQALREFFAEAEQHPGVEGAYEVSSVSEDEREVGILRTFSSEAARDAFYASEVYQRWTQRVEPLVDGPASRRSVHALGAFFRNPDGPPNWKMAVLTWIAVNPAVYLFANLVPWATGSALHPLVELLVVNLFVVATLTWAFMPVLIGLSRGWLAGGASASS